MCEPLLPFLGRSVAGNGDGACAGFFLLGPCLFAPAERSLRIFGEKRDVKSKVRTGGGDRAGLELRLCGFSAAFVYRGGRAAFLFLRGAVKAWKTLQVPATGNAEAHCAHSIELDCGGRHSEKEELRTARRRLAGSASRSPRSKALR